MKTIYWFDELTKENIPEVGGKGANLGEMTRAGFPVPEGFCVSSGAYFEHIYRNGIDKVISEQTASLDVHDIDALNKASTVIKNAILSGEIPKEIRDAIVSAYKKLGNGRDVYVAVRSSATAEDLPNASFAGQQSTFLNVSTPGDVVQAVKECWASLFEPRAIFYREENGFDHLKVGLSAVVQRMVQSDVAGVAFTVDPVSEDPDLLVIEAAYGLGEAVVSGSLTPDRYVVRKSNMNIVDKRIVKQTWKIAKVREKNEHVEVPEDLQDKQKLPDEKILELADICMRIEKHYGRPQDIEWAMENNKLYIVQARPITTLSETIKREVKIDVSRSAKVLVRGLPGSPGIGKGKVRIIPTKDDINKLKEGEILVTYMTSPDFVPAMEKAAAIITDAGGATSHAAIVSRELGVPCIVGTGNATEVLKDGMFVTVDATRGIVYEGDVKLEEPKKTVEPGHILSGKAVSEYVPITATKIYVNLAEPKRAQEVAAMPVDGVGLLRAEFMIAGIGKHPRAFIDEGEQDKFIDALADGLRTIAAAFYPRPVVYRATDFKTNEYRSLEGGERYEKEEENPMLGFRGAARYIHDPEVFEMELKAIKRVREDYGLKNLWLMIPFVRRVGELKQVKDIMHRVGLYRTKDFKLWIMVEVPSTVILIDKFLEVGVDGVSIGTNDLTQLTLGVDRDNPRLANEFDERNEAVLESVRRVIEACRRHGVTVSVCGQAPSVYPEFAEKLVEFGVTSMSVNPDVIIKTRKIVAAAEKRVMLKLLRELRQQS
ncbi:phosphoenolpyruvate synthase [Candidatus Micrarchaeota archaeon]|nr:phosphoenolpyruvate synthase [Candidatus Micrarchaeota archaeon]